jgi:hypothetical protein
VPKESMGYAKQKKRKEKISMPKEHEKKMPKSMNNPKLKSMKKRKKKIEEKDSPYFQKATIKREIEPCTKEFRILGKISKFHTLAQS